MRYLGPHERVPAYATIEMLVDGEFRVPENNLRDSPFVVLFGRHEIEEWGVCKDFGLFDDAFGGRGHSLKDDTLILRARVAWIEPRVDGLLPREVVHVAPNAAPSFLNSAGSLQADLSKLWCRRRPECSSSAAGSSGGPAHAGNAAPADVVLVCEEQRFDADRVILTARSEFFGAMLGTRQFAEAEQEEVKLPDVPARALAAALRFMYTDEGPDRPSREETEELLVVASKLGIPGLLRLCSDRLRDDCLNVGSAVGLLRLADTHGAARLRAEALTVIGLNFDQVKTTPEWEDLLRSGMNPTLIQDTLQAVADAAVVAGRASIKQ